MLWLERLLPFDDPTVGHGVVRSSSAAPCFALLCFACLACLTRWCPTLGYAGDSILGAITFTAPPLAFPWGFCYAGPFPHVWAERRRPLHPQSRILGPASFHPPPPLGPFLTVYHYWQPVSRINPWQRFPNSHFVLSFALIIENLPYLITADKFESLVSVP